MKPCFKTPRVVASKEEWEDLKRKVFERDRWECQICGSRTHLTADHIIKRSQGGDDVESNLWTLCADCHRRKDERHLTPREMALVPIGSRYGQPCRFRFRQLS